MRVSKRPLLDWEMFPTIADRSHLDHAVEVLAPLCEVPISCQADAVEATESLKKIIDALPPVQERAARTTASTGTT